MPLYNIEAINIRSKSFGESDKIITLFSKSHGKIRAIAKGSRKTKSKFGGRLEVFSYNHLLLASARSLDIISQCETIETFYGLREDREKLNAGFYIVKLVDIITEERQRNDELFQLLLGSLYQLKEGHDADLMSRIFEVKLCEIEGFLPTKEMLEDRYIKLPEVVRCLKGDAQECIKGITKKDMDISGRIFRELISDHTGKDIRKQRSYL